MKKLVLGILGICLSVMTQASGFLNGNGTAGNPYLIHTAEQLNSLREPANNQPGKYYCLFTDVDLTTYLSEKGDAKGWEPIGTLMQPFQGKLDGNGKQIRGLWINRPYDSYIGLFGALSPEAEVRKLQIKIAEGREVVGSTEVGGLAGINMGKIFSCIVEGNIRGEGLYYAGGLVGVNTGNKGEIEYGSFKGRVIGDWGVGGLAGHNNRGALIIRSCSEGMVMGDWSVGGLTGINNESQIQQCYSKSNVQGDESIGGLIGLNSYGTVSETYSIGEVQASRHGDAGGLIGTNHHGKSGKISYFDLETSGQGGGIGTDYSASAFLVRASTTDEMKQRPTYPNWDFLFTWDIEEFQGYPFFDMNPGSGGGGSICRFEGEGTAEDPYQISNPKQLSCLQHYLGDRGRGVYFRITKDLDLKTFIDQNYKEKGWDPLINRELIPEEWNPFTDAPEALENAFFQGYLHGGGFTISGLEIRNRPENLLGLFGGIGKEGVLDSIQLTVLIYNNDIENQQLVSGIGALTAINNGVIVSSSSTGTIRGVKASEEDTLASCDWVGGLVGINNGRIGFSHSDIQITAGDNIGGFVAENNGKISVCYSTGSIEYAKNGAGGFIAVNKGIIEDCYSHTHIPKSRIPSGGFVALNYNTISRSYCIGFVPHDEYGFGQELSGGMIKGCYFDGETCGKTNPIDAGLGRTTIQMKEKSTFLNQEAADPELQYDFEKIWRIEETIDYPSFKAQRGMDCDIKGQGTESDPFLITDAAELDCLRNYLGNEGVNRYFKIANDIDLKDYILFNYPYEGWLPIGDYEEEEIATSVFEATLQGSEFEIQNLRINRPDQDNVGLFTILGENAQVENLVVTVEDSVKGKRYVGALAGQSFGKITNCSSTQGAVMGTSHIGGLAGLGVEAFDCKNECEVKGAADTIGGIFGELISEISKCLNKNTVKGNQYIGGLAGYAATASRLIESKNESEITGVETIGGIAGKTSSDVMIACCSNKGNLYAVEGRVGGIAGWNIGVIHTSLNSASLYAEKSNVGGLVGFLDISGEISSSYNTGTVKAGLDTAGGLAGKVEGGSIQYSYNIGKVELGETEETEVGERRVGGLVGSSASATYTDCFFDNISSGQEWGDYEQSSGISGLSTLELKKRETFTNWDFSDIWGIAEELSFPMLLCQDCNVVLSITGELSVKNEKTYTYQTQEEMQEYLWFVTGGEIKEGQGTPKITIRWEEEGIQKVKVSVRDVDGCYSFHTPVLSVQVTGCNLEISLSGPTTCYNGTKTYTYTTESGKNNYNWTISGGNIISGQGTSQVEVQWTTPGEQSLSVDYMEDECTAESPETLSVTVNSCIPDITITGPVTVMEKSTGNIYTTESGMENYNWMVTGGTITSGLGTRQITVTWNTPGNQTVSVNYKNEQGCSAVGPKKIGVTVSSCQPNIYISGSTYVVEKRTGYSYSTENGMEDYTWIVTGGTITSGLGTRQITVIWNKVGTQYVSVNYKNEQGCTAVSPKKVGVTVISCQPFYQIKISGPTLVKKESTDYIYTTQPGMIGYTWTIVGGTIIAGHNTNSITVTWTQSGAQSLSVNYKDDERDCMAENPCKYNVTVIDNLYTGSGTFNDPFQLKTAKDIDDLRQFTGPVGRGVYFKLVNSVEFGNYIWNKWGSAGWDPIGTEDSPFLGILTTDPGKYIAGMYSNRPTTDHVGLFGVLGENAKIQNLYIIISDSGIKGKENVGLLVGKNQGTIKNCISTNYEMDWYWHSYIELRGNTVGGMVGWNTEKGVMDGCGATMQMLEREPMNNTSQTQAFGGLVGRNDGLIGFSFSVSDIKVQRNFVGGFAGYNNGIILACYSLGSLEGKNYCGGFVGSHYSGVILSSYTGTYMDTYNSGGFAGSLDYGDIEGCYSRVSPMYNNNPNAFIGKAIMPYQNLWACFFDVTRNENNRPAYWYESQLAPKETGQMVQGNTYRAESNPNEQYWCYEPKIMNYYGRIYPYEYMNFCNLWDFNKIWTDNTSRNFYPTLGATGNPLSLSREYYEGQNLYPYYQAKYEHNNTSIELVKKESFQTKQSIQLYPNPTRGKVIIQGEDGGFYSIEVYSTTGQFLFKTNKPEVDLSAYPNGVYMVKVNGKTYKVLLNKN